MRNKGDNCKGKKLQKKFFFSTHEIELIEEYGMKHDISGSFQSIVKQAAMKEIRYSILEELSQTDSALAEKIKNAKDAGELIDIIHDKGFSRNNRIDIRKGLQQLEKWEEDVFDKRRRF